MSRFRLLSCLCVLSALPLTSSFADEAIALEETMLSQEQPALALPPAPTLSSTPAPAVAAPKPIAKAPEAPFRPFTGKIKGKKVRMRANADLESTVIREVNKNDMLSIVGEKGDFWAVEPPAGTKAYVFRSFILDNVVEGNRVNVRLKPDLESPIIGHLTAGEKVHGTVSNANNKWLEIPAPTNTRFYVAKDFIENAGGPEMKAKYDKRKATVEQLLDSTALLSKSEMQKPYDEIEIERFVHNYNAIIHDYKDFPDHVAQAKEALTHLQENYTQKKIAHLETKASKNGRIHHATHDKELAAESIIRIAENPTDRMKLWEPIEESLYLTWAHVNEDRNMDEYYTQQTLNATPVTGILEAYHSPNMKNKPGDFILRDKDLPVAYVYSTKVNLQDLVGKKVTLMGAQRPNNNFAFPAYFVLAAE
jgi:uncharacterized protein YgiM (DUF1202 family)